MCYNFAIIYANLKPCYRGENRAMPPTVRYVPKFTTASRGPPCDRTALVVLFRGPYTLYIFPCHLFLLCFTAYNKVIISCPILHLFGDTTAFVCAPDPPLFHPNFGGVSVAPDHPCWGSVSRCLKLFDREIIFEVFQPVWKTYLNVTNWQTDRQTDDMQFHNRALLSIAR